METAQHCSTSPGGGGALRPGERRGGREVPAGCPGGSLCPGGLRLEEHPGSDSESSGRCGGGGTRQLIVELLIRGLAAGGHRAPPSTGTAVGFHFPYSPVCPSVSPPRALLPTIPELGVIYGVCHRALQLC